MMYLIISSLSQQEVIEVIQKHLKSRYIYEALIDLWRETNLTLLL